jgi:hypothetical protein
LHLLAGAALIALPENNQAGRAISAITRLALPVALQRQTGLMSKT